MSQETQQSKKKKWMFDILQFFCLILAVFVLRAFVIGTIYVKGSSMEPNFHHGDFLMINKLEAHMGNIDLGDVVICRMDEGSYQENIIKRVVGLPNDVIDWQKNDMGTYDLYINGEYMEEPYIRDNVKDIGNVTYPYTVPENTYFVMGDNRNTSTDSRRTSIGVIEEEDIIGCVWMRLYPFHDFGLIEK